MTQRVGLTDSNKEKLDTKEYSSLPFVNLKRKNEKTEQEDVLVQTNDEKEQFICPRTAKLSPANCKPANARQGETGCDACL